MLPPTGQGGVLGAELRQHGTTRRYSRGQALFVEGDLADRVFLILSGWVLISCASAGGREIVLALCGEHDLIGEMSLLDGEPRSASVVALTAVETQVAPGSRLTRVLSQPDAAHDPIRMLLARVRDGDRKRLEFANLDTLGRVSERLLELTDRFGRIEEGKTVIEIPLSQHQLASWCAASRESTVRALATLRTLKCITTGRQRIVIDDPGALQRHAGRTS